MTIDIDATLGHQLTRSKVHRRKFLKGMAAVAGLGLSAGLVACGDNTNTAAPVATTAAATTVAATTAATTVAATTAATTTAAPTTVAPTTAAATAAPTTAAAGATTAAAAGAAPAGFSEVGKLPTSAAPVSFTAGGKKGFIYAKSATEVTVFSNLCTHQNCEVPYVEADKKFECPCHGSQYDINGEIVKGPAKARLPLFENKVIGGMIYAKLS